MEEDVMKMILRTMQIIGFREFVILNILRIKPPAFIWL